MHDARMYIPASIKRHTTEAALVGPVSARDYFVSGELQLADSLVEMSLCNSNKFREVVQSKECVERIKMSIEVVHI